MDLHFEPVTDENREEVLGLSVFDFQKDCIESVSQCLEEAGRISAWRPVAIYDGEVMTGFAMYGAFMRGDEKRVWLDRLLVDKRYQGRGIGKASVRKLIDRIREEYAPERIYLSVYENNEKALRLYEKEGFRFNGELDYNGEKVMTLEL